MNNNASNTPASWQVVNDEFVFPDLKCYQFVMWGQTEVIVSFKS